LEALLIPDAVHIMELYVKVHLLDPPVLADVVDETIVIVIALNQQVKSPNVLVL
jgi:hypothetical protein